MGFFGDVANYLTAIPQTIIGVAGDKTQKEAQQNIQHKGLVPTASHALDSPKKKHLSALLEENTGWRGSERHVAQGVVWAESGGDPTAQNSCCTGLLQMHYVHCGDFGLPKDRKSCEEKLKDPVVNLKAAYALWQQTTGHTSADKWAPWEGYTNGHWRGHTNFDPLIALDPNTVGGAVGDAAEAIYKPLDDFFSALLSASTWLRVGKGILGGILIIAGVGAIVFIVAQRVQSSAVGKSLKKAM